MGRPATGMSSASRCQSTTLLLLLPPLSLQDGHRERHRSPGSDGGGSSGPSAPKSGMDPRSPLPPRCYRPGSGLGTPSGRPSGAEPSPVLDPCCFLLTAPSQRRLSPTTRPIVTNLLGSRLDRFPGYDTDDDTAGSLGDITQSQHQHYHHRREPEMVKDVVRPSAGTIVSGREKKGWRPRGGGGAQQRCFTGLQQNFHGSDSPIPTALPPTKTPCRVCPPSPFRLPHPQAAERRPHAPPISQRSSILIKLP